MTNHPVAQLEQWIRVIPNKLKAFPEESMVHPRAVGKWSNLQILGHLCDSAINNLTRFIQVQYAPEPMHIIPYDQDKWVAAQRYSDVTVEEVISLWVSLNHSLVRVLTSLPADLPASRAIILPSGEQRSVEWLITDYVEHMKHHLNQISAELVE